jgi:ribosomal RNA assembly protein
MKYLRIPKDRIGVLVGHNGEIKKQIETQSGVTLEINSTEGEITINDQGVDDPLIGMKIETLIRAIGRGFSPDYAMMLLDDDMEFFMFDIHDYVGKKPAQIHRVKSRIIGRHGKTKRVIEELTGAHLSIYGHTVSIVTDIGTMDVTKKAVDMLLSGSKHFTVYRFLERELKKLRMTDLY